jgi:hypothetical protein
LIAYASAAAFLWDSDCAGICFSLTAGI